MQSESTKLNSLFRILSPTNINLVPVLGKLIVTDLRKQCFYLLSELRH